MGQVVAGKEPIRKDLNGRITKQDGHRWTKEWVSEFILGKGGNYAARAVVVGDPYIGIEEIGVPSEISRKLTIPDRANRWNCSKLQEYVTRTQSLEDDCSNLVPGARKVSEHAPARTVPEQLLPVLLRTSTVPVGVPLPDSGATE